MSPVATAGLVRGRATHWDDDLSAHVFAATGQPVPAFGGEEPACQFCGLTAEPNGPDPCLGEIPGVASACCGHGVHEGWIRFEHGPAPLAVRVDYPGLLEAGSRDMTASVPRTLTERAASFFGVRDTPRQSIVVNRNECLLVVYRYGERQLIFYSEDGRRTGRLVRLTSEEQVDDLVDALTRSPE